MNAYFTKVASLLVVKNRSDGNSNANLRIMMFDMDTVAGILELH